MSTEILIEEGDSKAVLFSAFAMEYTLEQLTEQVEWKQNEIKIFGKIYPEPRLTEWYGSAYTYSNIHWPQKAFPSTFQKIKQAIEAAANWEFDALLLNYYRDGQDSMGWHRDNEPELDQTCIASLSLGQTRTFKIRHRESKTTWNISLKHGDLLLMWNLQSEFEHSIPKSKKPMEPRLNLTFRRMKSEIS